MMLRIEALKKSGKPSVAGPSLHRGRGAVVGVTAVWQQEQVEEVVALNEGESNRKPK